MISITTLLNQGFTVILLVQIIYLFDEWRVGTWRALKRLFNGKNVSGTDWIMIAIMGSHIGFFLDNLYWLVAWSGRYLEQPWGTWLNDYGVFANTVFRQGFGVATVSLHLIAARFKPGEKIFDSKMKRILLITTICGAIYTFILWFLRVGVL